MRVIAGASLVGETDEDGDKTHQSDDVWPIEMLRLCASLVAAIQAVLQVCDEQLTFCG